MMDRSWYLVIIIMVSIDILGNFLVWVGMKRRMQDIEAMHSDINHMYMKMKTKETSTDENSVHNLQVTREEWKDNSRPDLR